MKQIATKQPTLMQSLFTSITKRVIVAIILVSMILNGFVPASQQSKENLFLITTAVITSSIFEVFNQCQNKLTEISNSLAKDLYKLLLSSEVGADVPYNGKDQQEPMPVNTSSDMAVVIERDNSFKLIKYIINDNQPILAVGKIQEDLYIFYKHIKDCCSNTGGIIILFFILFIVTIRNRKEDITNKILIRVIEYKTNLC